MKEINDKLKIDYLNFLDFSSNGEFEACPWDDFVRIVIQFREKKPFTSQPDSFAQWIPIQGSKSSNSASNICNSLWIFGLDHFEQSLFFENEEILKNLNIILSGQRDFLNFIEYPEVKLPTRLQTTKLGAQFLANCGRPIANYNQIISQRSQIKSAESGLESEKQIVEKYNENMLHLDIPNFAKEYKSKLWFSTKNGEMDVVATVAEGAVAVNFMAEAEIPVTGTITETIPEVSGTVALTATNPDTGSTGNSQNDSVLSEKSLEQNKQVDLILAKVSSFNRAYKSKSTQGTINTQYEVLFKQEKDFEANICKALLERLVIARKSDRSSARTSARNKLKIHSTPELPGSTTKKPKL